MCDITYKQKIYFNNNYLLYMVWVMADIDHLHISNFFFVNYTFYSSNFPLSQSHDITEIWLKMALNTINQPSNL